MSGNYAIDVERRALTSAGADVEPFVAVAMRVEPPVLIAVQFGSDAQTAFAKALRYVEEDRQREPVRVVV